MLPCNPVFACAPVFLPLGAGMAPAMWLPAGASLEWGLLAHGEAGWGEQGASLEADGGLVEDGDLQQEAAPGLDDPRQVLITKRAHYFGGPNQKQWTRSSSILGSMMLYTSVISIILFWQKLSRHLQTGPWVAPVFKLRLQCGRKEGPHFREHCQ